MTQSSYTNFIAHVGNINFGHSSVDIAPDYDTIFIHKFHSSRWKLFHPRNLFLLVIYIELRVVLLACDMHKVTVTFESELSNLLCQVS